MKAHIVLYVGAGMTKDGNFISRMGRDVALAVVETAICNVAGGFTRTEVIGGWIDGEGKLIKEPAYKVEIIYDNVKNDAPKVALLLGKVARKAFNQAEVLIELIDGVTTLTSSRAY